MVSFDMVRATALSLPDVTEGISYGTASFKVKGRFLCRLLEDNSSISIFTNPAEREMWQAIDPKTFTVPDHYKSYNYMVVRLQTVSPEHLKQLLTAAWHERHPMPESTADNPDTT